MDGVAKKALEETPVEQTPEVVEGAMVFAAQQVLNANKAGVAKSPEQQLVILEQKKVELEQQKIQLDAANNAAEAALDAQKLQLEEAKLMKEVVSEGHQVSFRKEKADLDRASKETMKTVELLSKSALEDQKSEMKSLEMMIKMDLGEMKANLDENALKAKIMEKAEQIESDKNIKMLELINKVIEQETKGE